MQYEINHENTLAFRSTVIDIIKKYMSSNNTDECLKFIIINNMYASGSIVYNDMHIEFTDKFADIIFTQGNYKISFKINRYNNIYSIRVHILNLINNRTYEFNSDIDDENIAYIYKEMMTLLSSAQNVNIFESKISELEEKQQKTKENKSFKDFEQLHNAQEEQENAVSEDNNSQTEQDKTDTQENSKKDSENEHDAHEDSSTHTQKEDKEMSESTKTQATTKTPEKLSSLPQAKYNVVCSNNSIFRNDEICLFASINNISLESKFTALSKSNIWFKGDNIYLHTIRLMCLSIISWYIENNVETLPSELVELVRNKIEWTYDHAYILTLAKAIAM